MADVHTNEQRSYNMSRVKSKNTKPELLIFNLLEQSGVNFSRHYNILGKPDVVCVEQMLAIFIDGEFWHGRNFSKWKHKLTPFWLLKIKGNIKRDRVVKIELKKLGWVVLRFWAEDILKNPQKAVDKIIRTLN